MSETSGNTPTSMRGVCSPQVGGGGNHSGRELPDTPGLTHGDVWEAVGSANRDEAENTYDEDSVRVIQVVLPSAPRFDSSGVSHGDSACVPAGDGHDSHGCYGVVGDRAPQPKDNTGGITDGVSCGMSGERVKHGAATVVPAPTIGALAGDTDPHSGGRCDSGSAGIDENMRGRAGGGVDCCGGEDGAVIDADSSPQRPTQRILDSGVSLFDVPVVLERRYITTPPNGDEETPESNNTSAATSVDGSADEEAGAPLSRKSRKDVSSSNTCGDSCGDITGSAAPSSDGDNECSERHQESDCRG